MSSKNTVQAIVVHEIDAAALGAPGWTLMTNSGLEHSCFMIRFINTSDVDIAISYDNASTNEIVRANSDVTLNFQSNSSPSGHVAMMAKGTNVWCGSLVAGVGAISLVGYYQV